MRICFVTDGKLRAFREGKRSGNDDAEKGNAQVDKEQQADIYLFGFGGMGEVSYEKELKGETKEFEDAALLSKEEKSVVVCGCVTDTRGHKRKSAVIAENGKLKGVSDMLNVVDGGACCGAALRIYDTRLGKMGVVVAEDMRFPDVVKSLSICGCDFIVCPFGKITDALESVLLRACAYSYGIPIFLCAEKYCMIADVSGNLAFSSPQSPVYVDFENVHEYHLVETRRRGFYRCT